jgi:hypothetical protein
MSEGLECVFDSSIFVPPQKLGCPILRAFGEGWDGNCPHSTRRRSSCRIASGSGRQGEKNECPITLRQKSTEGNHAPDGSL